MTEFLATRIGWTRSSSARFHRVRRWEKGRGVTVCGADLFGTGKAIGVHWFDRPCRRCFPNADEVAALLRVSPHIKDCHTCQLSLVGATSNPEEGT